MEENCILRLFGCTFLSAVYVLSLYIWQNSSHNRNDPSTIKKRCVSVIVMGLMSPAFLYIFCRCDMLVEHSIFDVLGIKIEGLFMASTVPLILTVILFLGPIAIHCQGDGWRLYSEPMYWVDSCKDIKWWRDQFVAPLSEEITFRACMLPILVHCFRPQTAVFVCPIFFGVAHLHHIIGRVKDGYRLKTAVMVSVFQLLYTTMFGAYSAFLFLRTGHLIAPFLAHAFCNLMGFPHFQEALMYKEPNRTLTFILCVFGLVFWSVLLIPLTNPAWYKNNLYWK